MLKKIASMFKRPEGGQPVRVAVFGKHPGWNDHIDDIGLDSELLVKIKHQLYVEGIGGNIDSGSWEKLGADQLLPGFNHAFVWSLGSSVIAGRCWSSTDGKGRARYPMIVCAESTGMPRAWSVERVLPRLERLEHECKATDSASGVIAAAEVARGDLISPASGPVPQHSAGSERALTTLATHPDMGDASIGLLRVWYQIEREMGAYTPAEIAHTGRSRKGEVRPQHMRVPACEAGAEGALSLWLSFLSGRLAEAAPVLVIRPVDEPFVDVLVGEPTASQFYAIRASLGTIPYTTDIPYTLEDEFIARVRGEIASAASGGSL